MSLSQWGVGTRSPTWTHPADVQDIASELAPQKINSRYPLTARWAGARWIFTTSIVTE